MEKKVVRKAKSDCWIKVASTTRRTTKYAETDYMYENARHMKKDYKYKLARFLFIRSETSSVQRVRTMCMGQEPRPR